VKILLEANATVTLQTSAGWTALHHAARNGHLKVAKMLLEAKVDVTLQTNGKETALHHAAENGHKEIVKMLLEAKMDVEVQDEGRRTALYHAAENGHLEIVKVLLDVKADVTAQDKDGRTAQKYAAENGHSEVLNMLFDADVGLVHNMDGLTEIQRNLFRIKAFPQRQPIIFKHRPRRNQQIPAPLSGQSKSSIAMPHTAIVGAGIIGASTAYFLTHSGSYNSDHSITILDSNPPGSGASGKSAGFITRHGTGAATAALAELGPGVIQNRKLLADENASAQ
jgi:hypothetical protein